MIRSCLYTVLLLGILIAAFPLHAAEVLCPLTGRTFSAELEPTEFTVTTNTPAYVTVRLDPPEPPAGSTVSTLTNVIEAPSGAKPEILPGFPRVRLGFDLPGRYVIEVRITLITKSSCGGVEADMLSEGLLIVQVTEPAAQ